jgi:hypothetical protein
MGARRNVLTSTNQRKGMAFYYDTPGLLYDSPGVTYDAGFFLQQRKKRMDTIKLDFKNKDALQTIQFGKDIKSNMILAVADFATPEPSNTDFQSLITAAETANNEYVAILLMADTKLLERDDKVELLRGGIRDRAAYAEDEVDGDPMKLQPIFTLRATPSPIGDLTQVLNLSLTAGESEGELDPAWDKLRGARSYEIQISIDPPTGGTWVHKMSSTKSRCTLVGLTSGAKIWVRVRGVGAAGVGPWSDPAVKIVP